jgi:hypothetical protein
VIYWWFDGNLIYTTTEYAYNIEGNAMSVKKVSELAKKFQVKLAQHAKGDPLDFEGAKKELGAITDVKEYGKHPQSAPKPAPKPQLATSIPGTAGEGDLPADLKQMLDIGAPGLKGMLKLTLDGKNVGVAFNADRWTNGASSLKRVLTNALSPKYMVGDPIGYFNPTWTFNY